MSPILIGVLGILLFFILLAMRMQISFAMILVGFIGFMVLNSFEASFGLVGILPFDSAADYILSVIPLFILMGQFAYNSEMGADVYRIAYKWIGHLPGGLAMATVGACACFAAISGSSLATAATFGMVALPEMRKFKYSDALATGCIAAGGTLGILIPPSTVLIIYGILTETGIAKLLIAGIFPGILLSFLFIMTIYIIAKRNPEMGRPGPKHTIKEKIHSLKDIWGLLLLFLVVMGGLTTGLFTPTEAAGIGAFGAFILTFLKKRLTWATLLNSLKESTKTTAMVFAIILGAMIFQKFITLSQIPNVLSILVTNLGVHPMVIMSLIILLFIVMGCFMEGLSIMILAIPILFPIVKGLGFDPVWFGVIITLTMEMSLITPPVGVNVFILHGVAKDIPISTMFRGIFPFWIAMLGCIIILMIFPEIATFLPYLMLK